MNLYYILAIIFGALTAYCGFKGSEISSEAQAKKNSEEQSINAKRIENQLNNLGAKLVDAQNKAGDDGSELELKKLQDEYVSIAKSFYKELPVMAEKEKAKNAESTIKQLELSREIGAHIHNLEKSSQALIEGFNKVSSKSNLVIYKKDFPINIFQSMQEYRILFSYKNKFYWLLRFVKYDATDGPIALQIVRVLGNADASIDDNFSFTNDSINLVFLADNQFGISLNQNISKDIKDDFFSDISLEKRNLSEFDVVSIKILERIIKREIFLDSLREK